MACVLAQQKKKHKALCLLSQRTMLSFRDAERAGEAEQAGSADRQRAGGQARYVSVWDLLWFIPSIPNTPTSQPNVDH